MVSRLSHTRGAPGLLAWATAVSLLCGAPSVSAQEEPLPEETVPEPEIPTREFGKDDTPETAVNVSKDEEGLPQDFTIDFGDSSDWIQLVSGEWLKGNVERMRDGVLEFDSAELKLLTLDWKKTIALHSPAANTYVFTEGDDLIGPAMIDTEMVAVQTVNGMVVRPRSQLLGVIEHKPRERNYWSTRLRFGFSANAGNTEQVTFNAFWSLVREDSLTRAQLTYDGTFGTANKVENANRHLAGGDVDIFVHPILYVKALTGQLLYDKFQNIRLRATPAAGVGVHIITTYVVNWDFETALGYQYLSLIDPAAGVEDPQNDAYLMLRMFADLDFTDNIQLLLDWRSNIVYTTIGNTNHVGSADLSILVTTLFGFNFSFLYLRTEKPFPRSDGTVPDKNDYQFVVSLSLNLG